MRVSLELKDFAKYPFLKESQQFIAAYSQGVEQFICSNPGKIALKYSMERIEGALRSAENTADRSPAPVPSDSFGVKMSVSGYALARVLVTCTGERNVMERLSRYEANRAYRYLIDEEESKKAYIASSVGVVVTGTVIPVTRYVEIVSRLKDERWRLVNRDVDGGYVHVSPMEMDELVREAIRVLISSQLPLPVPGQICSLLSPYTEKISGIYQMHLLEKFGTVEEDCFPPCIQALIAALTEGKNIPHTGRFALTAFLHNIGMESTQIIELYCRAPDFDIEKTQYQVEHISGRGGTEYTAPSCAAMRTNSLCVKKDGICEKVNHPLSYYRIKKKREKVAAT